MFGLLYKNKFFTRHNESICVWLDRLLILEPTEIRRWKTRDFTGQRDEIIHDNSEIFRIRTNYSWRNCKSIHIKSEIWYDQRYSFQFSICNSTQYNLLKHQVNNSVSNTAIFYMCAWIMEAWLWVLNLVVCLCLFYAVLLFFCFFSQLYELSSFAPSYPSAMFLSWNRMIMDWTYSSPNTIEPLLL